MYGLTAPTLLEFHYIVDTLRLYSVQYAIGGGFVLAERHKLKTTNDIDIHVNMTPNLIAVVEHFQDNGWDAGKLVEIDPLSSLIRLIKGDAKIDFLVNNKIKIDYFSDAIVENIYGREVTVVSDFRYIVNRLATLKWHTIEDEKILYLAGVWNVRSELKLLFKDDWPDRAINNLLSKEFIDTRIKEWNI